MEAEDASAGCVDEVALGGLLVERRVRWDRVQRTGVLRRERPVVSAVAADTESASAKSIVQFSR